MSIKWMSTMMEINSVIKYVRMLRLRMLTFPSIYVIKVVQRILHNAVTHFTEVPVNNSEGRGW